MGFSIVVSFTKKKFLNISFVKIKFYMVGKKTSLLLSLNCEQEDI